MAKKIEEYMREQSEGSDFVNMSEVLLGQDDPVFVTEEEERQHEIDTEIKRKLDAGLTYRGEPIKKMEFVDTETFAGKDHHVKMTGGFSQDGKFIVDNIVHTKSAATWNGGGLYGAIPATDHDTLTAQAAAEKIVKGEPLVSAVDQITTTRATAHGRYRDTARISQSFKRVVKLELDDRLARGQLDLTDPQLESIDMICTKLARIISGDSAHAEHWLDVGGYAQIALEDK